MPDTDTPRTDYKALSRNEVQHLVNMHQDDLTKYALRDLIEQQMPNLNDFQIGTIAKLYAQRQGTSDLGQWFRGHFDQRTAPP